MKPVQCPEPPRPPQEPPRPPQERPRAPLSRKIGLVFSLLLLTGAANLVLVGLMLENLNGVAETINVAGRLRMLSQRIAFESVKLMHDAGAAHAPLLEAARDVDTALAALRDGGPAFGYVIAAAPAMLQPQCAATRRHWLAYREHVGALLGRAAGTDAAAATARIGFDAAALLDDAEALVAALTAEAQRAQRSALLRLYALFLFDAAALAGLFVAARRQIVAPLRQLVRSGQLLAAGDFAARSAHRAGDEIGQLAGVFNHAAGQMGELVARVALDRRSLQQAESMFRGLAENAVVGVYIAQGGAFRFANPKMAAMFGYDAAEMGALDALDIVADEDRPLVAENIARRLAGAAQEVHYERRARRKDGSLFEVEVFGSKMEIDGQLATIGVMLDVTERKRVDRALRVLIACNRALVRATDEQALLAEVCRIMQEVSGYPFVWIGYAEEGGGKTVRPVAWAEPEPDAILPLISRISWDESAHGRGVTGSAIRRGRTAIAADIPSSRRYAPWRAFMTRHGILSAMALPLKAGDKVFGALTVYSPLAATLAADEIRIAEELADNLAYGIAALRADAARALYAQQLEFHATHDMLTGLANRALLSDRLRQAIAAARRAHKLVGVLLLDLDDFKVVNDSFGHEAGDVLLCAVAARLRTAVRATDTVARLGGDEFVIVVAQAALAEDVAGVAAKVLDALTQSFAIGAQEVYVGASIGISVYPDDGEHDDTLLKSADLAMYHAKQKGRPNYCFFTESLNVSNRERHALQTELRGALARGELVVHYQAKVARHSRRLVGAEALVRWQHPLRGLIYPANFIGYAEESGLIVPIGAWVMQTACAQNMAWQAAGLAPIGIAVNLSAKQFHEHDLVGQVQAVLEQTGMAPRHLELEITESVLIQEAEAANLTLLRLRELGIELSLDDFGTGYSSLNYLKRFPLDNLKIDRSFVKGIDTNPHDAIIIKAVIGLAHDLNLKVIAEGVETQAELDFLDACGCEEVQGYYFSKPLPAEQFRRLLEKGVLEWAGNDDAPARAPH